MLRFILSVIATIMLASCAAVPLPRAPGAGVASVVAFDAPVEEMRARLLAATPPGSPAEVVSASVERELRAFGERRPAVIAEAIRLRTEPAIARRDPLKSRPRSLFVGVRSIQAYFDRPSVSMLVVPTTNRIRLSYAFDSQGRLLDLNVEKWIDGLP